MGGCGKIQFSGVNQQYGIRILRMNSLLNRFFFFTLSLALVFLSFVFLSVHSVFAQKSDELRAVKYPIAKNTEKELYTFDIARPIKHFDATPTGSNWFAVDEFGLMRTMIIRGTRF